MSPARSRELEELTAIWDKKLADSGFVDIEDRRADGNPLKSWHSRYFQCRYTPDEFSAKREYYELAQTFLHEHFFSEETLDYFGIIDRDKEVWTLHAEGRSIREIATILRTKKCRVEKTLSHLTERMMAFR